MHYGLGLAFMSMTLPLCPYECPLGWFSKRRLFDGLRFRFAHLSGVLQPYPCTATVGCQYNLSKYMQLSRTFALIYRVYYTVLMKFLIRPNSALDTAETVESARDLHISNFKVVISIILQF